jgi:hypothetical protein
VAAAAGMAASVPPAPPAGIPRKHRRVVLRRALRVRGRPAAGAGSARKQQLERPNAARHFQVETVPTPLPPPLAPPGGTAGPGTGAGRAAAQLLVKVMYISLGGVSLSLTEGGTSDRGQRAGGGGGGGLGASGDAAASAQAAWTMRTDVGVVHSFLPLIPHTDTRARTVPHVAHCATVRCVCSCLFQLLTLPAVEGDGRNSVCGACVGGAGGAMLLATHQVGQVVRCLGVGVVVATAATEELRQQRWGAEARGSRGPGIEALDNDRGTVANGREGGAAPAGGGAGWRGRAARLGVGRVVAGELGWAEYALLPESELVAAPEPGSDDQEEAMGGCGPCTGAGGDHGIANMWNRREISVSSYDDQSHYLHPHLHVVHGQRGRRGGWVGLGAAHECARPSHQRK